MHFTPKPQKLSAGLRTSTQTRLRIYDNVRPMTSVSVRLWPYNANAGVEPTQPCVHNVRFLCKQMLQRFQGWCSCDEISGLVIQGFTC